MKSKHNLLLLIIPCIFLLTGCSHISQIKMHPHRQANIQINGKSSKNRVYFRDKQIHSVKTENGMFEIDVPRSDTERTILISGNENLKSAKKIDIPASKPLCSWDDFVDEFNDAELKSDGTNNGPKIPNRLSKKNEGHLQATIRNQKFTFWVSNGNLMAVRIQGNYPINKFKYMVGIATSAAGPSYYLGEEAAQKLSVDDNPVKVINGSLGDGYHYHASNIYGKLTLDIFK